MSGVRISLKLWTQWSAAGTGDRGLKGLFPHGVRGSARTTTHGSAHQPNQRNDLEHGSRTRKWTPCEQPTRKASA